MVVAEGVIGVGGEIVDGTGLGSVVGKGVTVGVVAIVDGVVVGDTIVMGVPGSVDNVVGDINVGVAVGATVNVT